MSLTTNRANGGQRFDIPCIFLAGLGLFLLGQGERPFIEFEARFALFAKEMWRHGPSWFPTTYGGEAYPDYPATSTFLIWLCAHLTHGVTRLTALLPTALAASLNLVLSYRIVARHSREWALATVCFEIMAFGFLAEARALSLDQMVATVTLAVFMIVSDERSTARSWLGLAALLLLGLALRGPLGVVIPAGVGCVTYALSRRWSDLWRFGLLATVVLLGGFGLLLMLARWQGGAAFVADVLRMQVAGRMNAADASPVWYYFVSSLGNYAPTYPLALLTLVAVFTGGARVAGGESPSHQRAPKEALLGCRLLLRAAGWAAIILLGLSLPADKKPRYILAALPAMAILAGYLYSETFRGRRDRLAVYLGRCVDGFWQLLPLLLALTLLLARQRIERIGFTDWWMPLSVLAAAQIALLAARRMVSPASRRMMFLLLAMLLLWGLRLAMVEPVAFRNHDASLFVNQLEKIRRQQPGGLAFYKIGKDAGAIKYAANIDEDLHADFINRPADLATLRRPVYLVLTESSLRDIAALPEIAGRQPLMRAHFDRDICLVFFLAADPPP